MNDQLFCLILCTQYLMILNEDWSFKRKKWRSFYDFFLFSSPSQLYQYTITVGYISDYILLSSIDCDFNGSLRTQQLTHVLLTVLNKPLEKQTHQSFQVDQFVLNHCKSITINIAVNQYWPLM